MYLNILLVEDDVFFQEAYCNIIKRIDSLNRIFICNSKEDALEIARKEFIDIFVIDIALKESDGLDLAMDLRKMKRYSFSQILFVTVYDNLKLMAYENVRCFTFIDKKGDWKQRFEKAMAYIIENVEPLEKQKIKITTIDKTILLVRKDEIIYFESRDHRVIVWTFRGEYELKYITLTSLSTILGELFIRCHRSYVVNMQYIESINFKRREILMKSTKTYVPIGRFYLENMKKDFYNNLHNIPVISNS